MSVQWERSWSTEWAGTPPAGTGNAWNDNYSAASGFVQSTLAAAGFTEVGRVQFGGKLNTYLVFDLDMPKNATITEAMLTYVSGGQNLAGGATSDPNPTFFMGILPNDGRWNADESGYIDGTSAIDYGLDLGVSYGIGFETNNIRSPAAPVDNSITTEANLVHAFGQSWFNDNGAVRMNGVGMAVARSNASATGDQYRYVVYEMPAPDADLADCTFFAATSFGPASSLPGTGTPVDPVILAIDGTPPTMQDQTWYFIGLERAFTWSGSVQLVARTRGETTEFTPCTSDGGYMRGLVRMWHESPTLQPQYGLSRTGYTSSGHIPPLSTRASGDGTPGSGVFTGFDFGSPVGPFTVTSVSGTVNKIAEGFSDQIPTATVSGWVSELQAWVNDESYNPAITGRTLCLMLDESDAEQFGAFDARGHRIHSALSASQPAPVLTLRYSTPGGGETMRFREFGVESRVRTRGYDTSPVIRYRDFRIES